MFYNPADCYRAMKYYRDKGYHVHTNRYVTENLTIDVLAESNGLRIAIFFPISMGEAIHETVTALEYGYDNVMCFMKTKALAGFLKAHLETLRLSGLKVLSEKGQYEIHYINDFFKKGDVIEKKE